MAKQKKRAMFSFVEKKWLIVSAEGQTRGKKEKVVNVLRTVDGRESRRMTVGVETEARL